MDAENDYIEKYILDRGLCFHCETENYLPGLCELDVIIPNDVPELVELYVELRFGFHDEELAGDEYEVSAQKAHIRVECSGYFVGKRGRYGDTVPKTVKEQYISTSHSKNETDKSASLELGAKVDVASYTPTIKLEKPGVKATQERQAIVSSERGHPVVKATTLNSWRVEYPRSQKRPLDDKVLDCEKLCALQSKPGQTNVKIVDVFIEVKARDIRFIKQKRKRNKSRPFSQQDKTNEKLFKLLATKRLAEKITSKSEYKGKVIVSKSMLANDHMET
jgi:hypothetical protein